MLFSNSYESEYLYGVVELLNRNGENVYRVRVDTLTGSIHYRISELSQSCKRRRIIYKVIRGKQHKYIRDKHACREPFLTWYPFKNGLSVKGYLNNNKEFVIKTIKHNEFGRYEK